MIVKLDVFIQLEGEDILNPGMIQKFMSKSVSEYLERKVTSLVLEKHEFEFLKQLGIKSKEYSFLSEEKVLKLLK